jgi:hypothetical protein
MLPDVRSQGGHVYSRDAEAENPEEDDEQPPPERSAACRDS